MHVLASITHAQLKRLPCADSYPIEQIFVDLRALG